MKNKEDSRLMPWMKDGKLLSFKEYKVLASQASYRGKRVADFFQELGYQRVLLNNSTSLTIEERIRKFMLRFLTETQKDCRSTKWIYYGKKLDMKNYYALASITKKMGVPVSSLLSNLGFVQETALDRIVNEFINSPQSTDELTRWKYGSKYLDKKTWNAIRNATPTSKKMNELLPTLGFKKESDLSVVLSDFKKTESPKGRPTRWLLAGKQLDSCFYSRLYHIARSEGKKPKQFLIEIGAEKIVSKEEKALTSS